MGRSWLLDGEPAQAIEPLARALALQPGHLAAMGNLGVALLDAGRADEAVTVLGRAAQAHPNVAAVHYNLGNALLADARPAEARTAYRRAVALQPTLAAAWLNLGVAAQRAGEHAEADEAFRHTLALEPAHVAAHYNLACSRERAGELAQAAALYRATLALAPGHVDATLNLAAVLMRLNAGAQARELLTRALAITPGEARLQRSLGNCLDDLGLAHDARAAYDRAVALAPNDPHARFALACCRLSLGDWQAAWADYEARLALGALAVAPPPGIPRWDGERLAQGTLLVLAEQGLGDALQFVRYGMLLAQHGIHATLACDPRLVTLLRSAGGFASVVPYTAAPRDARAWLPLLSLPGVFATSPESVPSRSRYLHSDPARAAAWRTALEQATPRGDRGLLIGIAWQGNPAAERENSTRGRSPPLSAYAPLAALPGVRLVPLQKGPGHEQLEHCAFRDRIALADAALDTGADAFADTAALIDQLDLVVTSDTSVAHLAAALGCPTWIVLKYAPDWRWLRDRPDTPWYPSVRLFRQQAPGQWTQTMEVLAAALTRAADGPSAPRRRWAASSELAERA